MILGDFLWERDGNQVGDAHGEQSKSEERQGLRLVCEGTRVRLRESISGSSFADTRKLRKDVPCP